MKTVIRIKAVILPKDIKTKDHFWNAFGNCETEVSARWIVRFCKIKNSWRAFTLKQLTDFYAKKLGRKETFWFNRLDDKYIVLNTDKSGREWIKVTPLFIAKCYASTT